MIAVSAGVVSILGLVFAISLVAASKKFHVDENPKIEKISELLPGANCGACGYAGCAAYAKAIIAENAEISLCIPGGEDTLHKIASLLGRDAVSSARTTARLLCQGAKCGVKNKFIYTGSRDCASAHLLLGGPKDCSYGCLGFGDCMRVCPFAAITIDKKGLVIISEEKCKACGNCVKACPKKIIEIIPSVIQAENKKKERKFFYVACRSFDKGGIARKKCSLACIGCMKCVQECKFDAIKVENNCAKIDYTKCTNCTKCFKICPTDSIISLNLKIVKTAAA